MKTVRSDSRHIAGDRQVCDNLLRKAMAQKELFCQWWWQSWFVNSSSKYASSLRIEKPACKETIFCANILYNHPSTSVLYHLKVSDFRFVCTRPGFAKWRMTDLLHVMYRWNLMSGMTFLLVTKEEIQLYNSCKCLVRCVICMFIPEVYPIIGHFQGTSLPLPNVLNCWITLNQADTYVNVGWRLLALFCLR
jgi:hypothetical protein